MRKSKKRVISFVIAISLLVVSAVNVYALVKPRSFYDNISWTWSEIGSANSNYNCLSYAMGNTSGWTWPWGASNPTDAQVTSYLSSAWPISFVKVSNPTRVDIISYGSGGRVAHFSRGLGNAMDYECRAKWGELELMWHGSWDPYYSNSVYGSKMSTYIADY